MHPFGQVTRWPIDGNEIFERKIFCSVPPIQPLYLIIQTIWCYVSLYFTESVRISCRCCCMQNAVRKFVKVASLWFFQPLHVSFQTLVAMEFSFIQFRQCFVTINFLNFATITRCHISALNGIEQGIYFVHLQETYQISGWKKERIHLNVIIQG